jgi:hypothetical protein
MSLRIIHITLLHTITATSVRLKKKLNKQKKESAKEEKEKST